MSDEPTLTLDQFSDHLVTLITQAQRRHVRDLASFLRHALADVRVMFRNRPLAPQVLEDGQVAFRIRVSCLVCLNEKVASPRRNTVYVTQNPEDGSWTQACMANGDEVADLRTDRFICGPHLTQQEDLHVVTTA